MSSTTTTGWSVFLMPDQPSLTADNGITTTIASTSSPNSCSRCGVILGYEPHYCPIGTQPLIPQGWLCPVCGTVNAPWKATCGGSHPQPTAPATGANQ